MDAAQSIHVVVEGRVQGVGYRAWTSREAQRRQLHGWVRNRADGAVEVVFCGPEQAVQDMIAACRKGPASAQVRKITASAYTGGALVGFRVLPTD